MKNRFLTILAFSLLFSPILAAQDTKENANFKLAVNLYNDKLYDLALEQFRQFIYSYPNTSQGIEARFYLGITQMKMSKYDDARLTFQNFALAFPDNPKAPEAWWNVAESYVALKNNREAALAFERVKTFHPKSKLAPSALLKSAEYFEQAGDHESSKKVLRTLVQEYASADVVHSARVRLAEIYLEGNQWELARSEAKRVADASKDQETRPRALLVLAEALMKLDKSEDAKVALAEIIASYRLTPSYYQALNAQGKLHEQLGNLQEAIATWKYISSDSVQAPPSLRQEALIETGVAYQLRGDEQSALTQFERAAGIDGLQRGDALFKAGRAAERIKAYAQSQSFYARALRDSLQESSRKAAMIGFIRSATAARNFNDALRAFNTFREKYPNDAAVPKIIYEAAQLHLNHLKDPRQALSLFQEILNKYPESPVVDDALFGYAQSLEQVGSFGEAVEAFESLSRRFPSSEYVPQAKERINSLQLFELKNKESGLEKLALLLGDMIAQQSKSDLGYRLGEIYFHDLKDYERAATQYKFALDAGLDASKRAAAWFHQARSYEYLGRRESAKSEAFLSLSLASYDSLLKKYPTNEFYDDAVVALFQVKLTLAKSLDEVRKLGIQFLLNYSSVGKQGDGLLSLAQAYSTFGGTEDAIEMYKFILKNYPRAEAAGEASFQLARTLGVVGKKDSAYVILKEFISRYPSTAHSAEAYWMLGQASVERGNLDQALAAYQTIEDSFAYTRFSEQLDLARAEAYRKAGRFDQAVAQYRKLIVRENFEPLSIEVYFDLASSLDQSGNRSEAKKFYTAYLLRDTSSSRAGSVYFALARIAREEKNVELATRYLEEASRFGAATPGGVNQASLEAAELLFRNEDYESALKRFTEVLVQAKGDSLRRSLQSRIVVCYFRLNNLKEAEARANSFVKTFSRTDHHEAEFEYERGQYHLRRKEYDAARKFFENVTKKYSEAPIAPEASYWTARVFELVGRQQEAVKTYESILQKYPNNSIIPRTQLSLGNAYYNAEQWDPAARYYKAILDNEQRSPELAQYAMNNLILAYKELGLYDAALQLNRQYIDRFPDDAELINKNIDIGVLYQKLGYYDQSVLHLQSLLEHADADAESELRYYIGEAYYFKGDYQQAILEFLKVPYLVTKKTKVDWIATSYYMAGQSYEKMSKFDQAITMYRQILTRSGIDATFKTAAQKEIDRVNALVRANK